MSKRNAKNKQQTQARRGFLKGAVAATGAAAVAVATGSASATTVEPEVSAETLGKGYRETDHVRHYYKTAGM